MRTNGRMPTVPRVPMPPNRAMNPPPLGLASGRMNTRHSAPARERWVVRRRGAELKSVAVSLLALAILSSPAQSAFETLVAAVQPVGSEGGPEPTVTTYSIYIGGGPGAIARMQLTVAPNAIVSSSGVPVDRNLAHERGIRFVCAELADTLAVRVDLSAVKRRDATPELAEWDAKLFAQEAALALWCGLRNARSAWPIVRYVFYEIEGDTSLSRYTGVYSLSAVESYVAKNTWNVKTFGPDTPARQTGH